RVEPHRRRVRAAAGSTDRLSLWRLADDGHGVEPADPHRRDRACPPCEQVGPVTAQPSLADLIDAQIRAGGPISIASYMGLCLTHPQHGYYRQPDPFGARGDFITAPEISQMFGELIGFFLVNLWQQMREPKSFTL